MHVLSFDYTMELSSSEPFPAHEHAFSLHCLPQETKAQHVLECKIDVEPTTYLSYGIDGFGNSYCFGTIHGEHKVFRVNVKGKVQKFSRKKDDTNSGSEMIFRHESEMTKAGETLLKWNEIFNDSLLSLGFEKSNDLSVQNSPEKKALDVSSSCDTFGKVLLLSDFVHKKMSYVPSSTNAFTTAEEAAKNGKGVCQDFSQIMISLCRLQKIPCRYVAGILKGEGKSHAWVEAAINGKWIPLDPTNPDISQDEQIIFSRGRDSLDCEINRGVYRGSAFSNQEIKAELFVEE